MRSVFLCLVLACATSAWVLAGDSDKGKSETRSITGCLTQGDSPQEFNLRADDGSTWEVRSGGASLAEHVGHKVTLTGLVSNKMAHNLKEDAKDAAHDTGIKKSNEEHGHLKATDVQMVSHSCSQ